MKNKYRRRVLRSFLEDEQHCYIVWRVLECGHQFHEKKNTALESYLPTKIKPARFRVCELCRTAQRNSLSQDLARRISL